MPLCGAVLQSVMQQPPTPQRATHQPPAPPSGGGGTGLLAALTLLLVAYTNFSLAGAAGQFCKANAVPAWPGARCKPLSCHVSPPMPRLSREPSLPLARHTSPRRPPAPARLPGMGRHGCHGGAADGQEAVGGRVRWVHCCHPGCFHATVALPGPGSPALDRWHLPAAAPWQAQRHAPCLQACLLWACCSSWASRLPSCWVRRAWAPPPPSSKCWGSRTLKAWRACCW